MSVYKPKLINTIMQQVKSRETKKMSELIFRYGVMGSGKSAKLLIDLFAFESNHTPQKTLVIKPSFDTRDIRIQSRIPGLCRNADLILEPDETLDTVKIIEENDYVFVDEVQFLSPTQVEQLWLVSFKIPVVCYGIKTDFQGHLFPGAKRLFELADRIECIDSMCRFCNKPAMWNLRHLGGQAIFVGPQVAVGAEESYYPSCKWCVVKAGGESTLTSNRKISGTLQL